MRVALPLLLIAGMVAAKPPESKDFVRMNVLIPELAKRAKQLAEAEEYAKKPREEKMLITFARGERVFEKKKLDGEFVAKTILDWAEVNQDPPTDAAKRCLELLPVALEQEYARVVEVDKRERYAASRVLVKALDSDYLHVRISAVAALKKVYRTENAFMYEPEMDKRDRKDAIRRWDSFIKKQR